MANLRINISYGDAHSKRYQPSVISSFLIEKDEKGNIIRFNNDVKLLLRQKDLHKSIGYDCIRAYVDTLNRTHEQPHNLTDDQLMSLIPPDGIDTITDVYQYNKYLDAHKDTIKKHYDEYQARAKREKEWYKYYSSSSSDEKEKGE